MPGGASKIAVKHVLGSLAVACAAGVAVYLYLRSTADGPSASAVLVIPSANSATPLASLARGATPLTILGGMARSSAVLDTVGTKYGMDPLYARAHIRVTVYSESGQIRVTALDNDPARAKSVVDSMLTQLRATAQKASTDIGANQAADLKSQMDRVETAQRRAEDDLLARQQRLKIGVDPENPTSPSSYIAQLQDVEVELGGRERAFAEMRRTAIQRGRPVPSDAAALAGQVDWQGRLKEVEYDYRVGLTRYGQNAPEVERLRRQIGVTQRQVEREVAAYILSVQSNLDPPIAALAAQIQVLNWKRAYLAELARIAPAEAMALSRSMREVQTLRATADDLRKSYEQKRLDSEIYRVPYAVLVPPSTDISGPNRTPLMAGLGAFGGVFALLLVWVRGRRKEVA